MKQGYEKTNIRQIAAELGISLGLVSYYFPTKRDLVKQLFSQQLAAETELVRQYILQEEDPILFTGTLTKLQMTILSSPLFKGIYLDALREDIICDVIVESGLETYQIINQKYHLNLSDDYLALYGNYTAIALERVLVLYGDKYHLTVNVPDTIFKSYMRYLYGDEELLERYCRQTDRLVLQILSEHPKALCAWLETGDEK